MQRSKAEKRFLIIYTIMTLAFLVTGTATSDAQIVLFGTLPELFAAFGIYYGQPLGEKFRGTIYSCVCLITLTAFGILTFSMSVAMPVMAGALFLICLFNIPELLILWIIDCGFLFWYHLTWKDTYDLVNVREWLVLFSQILMVLLLLYLANAAIRGGREKNRKLSESIQQMKAAEKSRDDFMAGVSHEFMTPLNAILGMGELILDGEASKEVKEAAESILVAGQNLKGFVSDVFEYVEISGGRMTAKEEAYDFKHLLGEITALGNTWADEKNLALIVDCDARIPKSMIGDVEKLKKVMMTYLSCAVRFTERGFIHVKIDARKESYGVNLNITFKDTGIGMSKEIIKQIFQNPTAGEYHEQWTGNVELSLTLARMLVEMMNGLISLTSSAEEGTEIKIVIPQGIADSGFLVELPHSEEYHVLGYLNLDHYAFEEIRGAYVDWAEHMGKSLSVAFDFATNLEECKKRLERRSYTHLFISPFEFRQAPEFFRALTKRMRVVLVVNRGLTQFPEGDFDMIYKPLTILGVADALLGKCEKPESFYHLPLLENGPEAEAVEPKVLVVDDNAVNLKVMEGMLGKYGIVPDTATDGKTAVEKIEKAKYALVLMDYMMPGMDGAQTLEKIRNLDGIYYKKLPIICVTANTTPGTAELMMEKGFDDCLTKPVEPMRLDWFLKKYIGKTRESVQEDSPESAKQTKEAKEERVTSARTSQAAGGEAQKKPKGLSAIDRKLGENYCGGPENYEEILKMFVDVGIEKCREIARLYEKEDWQDYCIEAHALKGTALGIGAVHLSELAKQLEAAAKDGQIATIHAGHGLLMEEYKTVLDEIEQMHR